MKVSVIPREPADRWEASEQALSPRQVVDFHYHEEWPTVVRGEITPSTVADTPFYLERRQEKLALDALDLLAVGVLVVDGAARVLFANAAAREIAAAGDVLVLTDVAVRPRRREQGDVFRRFVGSAAAGKPGGSLVLSRPPHQLPVSALVTPLASTLAMSPAAQSRLGAAAIFLSDPERQAVTPTEHLRALYKLSPTEARVAWLITRSVSIGRAAKALGLAPETVRTHLKHIYAKTGVNRQSALAHVLAAAAVTRVP
jgi:DNA-binding CsgD family transcriptional regulator